MKKCKSINKVINGLEVTGTEKRGTHTYYKCVCIYCGTVIERRSDIVKNGLAKCDCQYKSERHGQTRTPLYRAWSAMRNRCQNASNEEYKNYGERGIKVCKEWGNSFCEFYKWSMLNGYKDGLTIDRIDNNKGYSPDNCRWVDMKTQCNNRRSNRMITYNGKTQTMSQWADELGINYRTLKSRINQMKWSIDKAFNEPIRKKG